MDLGQGSGGEAGSKGVRADGSRKIQDMPSSFYGIKKESYAFFRKQPKVFAYDHCFWSCNENDAHYVSKCYISIFVSISSRSILFSGQNQVFDCLGYELLDNAFDGYNACILAYGQTGKRQCG